MLQQIADTLETNINDLLDGKTVFVNNTNQQGGVGYAEIVNQLSESLIELLKDKDKTISRKNKEIEILKEKLNLNKKP